MKKIVFALFTVFMCYNISAQIITAEIPAEENEEIYIIDNTPPAFSFTADGLGNRLDEIDQKCQPKEDEVDKKARSIFLKVMNKVESWLDSEEE